VVRFKKTKAMKPKKILSRKEKARQEQIIEDIKITETFYWNDYQKQNNIKFSDKVFNVYVTLLHKAGDNLFKPFPFSLQKSEHYLQNINQEEFNQICSTLKKHEIIDFTIPIDKKHQTIYKVNLFKDRE